MRFRRRTYFVDKNVQGALALRVVGYWAACLWGVFCVLVGFPLILTSWFALPNSPSPAEVVYQTWADFWPAIVASLLMLPFLVKDVIRVSNRFVGPFFRLRGAMRQLAAGEFVGPIKFRKHDFWYEVAEDFNKIATRVAANKDSSSAVDEHSEELVEA